MISARAACRILGAAGVSKRRALQVLHAGLAGEAVDGRTVTLYDEDRVQALARRDVLMWPEVEDRCPAGFFVSRREFAALAPRDEQLAALAGGFSRPVRVAPGSCTWDRWRSRGPAPEKIPG